MSCRWRGFIARPRAQPSGAPAPCIGNPRQSASSRNSAAVAATLPLLAYYRALPRPKRTAPAVSHFAMLFTLAPRHDLTWGAQPLFASSRNEPQLAIILDAKEPIKLRKRGRGLRVERSDTARRGSAIGRRGTAQDEEAVSGRRSIAPRSAVKAPGAPRRGTVARPRPRAARRTPTEMPNALT